MLSDSSPLQDHVVPSGYAGVSPEDKVSFTSTFESFFDGFANQAISIRQSSVPKGAV